MSRSVKLFDSHLHIIDPRFPLVANNGFLPDAFTCNDYLNRLSGYDLRGGVIVSGSFQGFDQGYLLAALESLGLTYVGITQLPHTASDQQILNLNSAGVRGLRFNLYRGGSETRQHLARMARRVHELAGWHVELYIDSTQLEQLSATILQLPSVSIDHLGLRKTGFSALVGLAEKGVRIKASGFGRTDLDIEQAMREIFSANPDVLMFGSDLPSTRARDPFRDHDVDRVLDAIGPDLADKVLYRNALQFYRVKFQPELINWS